MKEPVLPEFRSWIVVREDGNQETFDPLTLISSFFESEIDLEDAAELFDRVVAQIESTKEHCGISHKTIHETVVRCLLGAPHPNARTWLTNYESIYSPEAGLGDRGEEYIQARHVSKLKQPILEILAERLGQRNPKDVAMKLGRSELDVILARLIKVIRYCGF